MTDRELLKDAVICIKNLYELYQDDFGAHFGSSIEELIKRIDSALADTGNMDAEQLVGQIRDHFHSDPDEDGIRKTEWDIDIDEAAALIEQYAAKHIPIESKKMEFVPCEEHEEPKESEIGEINRALEMAEKVLIDTKTRLNHYQFNTLMQIHKAQDIMADGLPRRVPREMLQEAYILGRDDDYYDRHFEHKNIDVIAAKYGYKVED